MFLLFCPPPFTVNQLMQVTALFQITRFFGCTGVLAGCDIIKGFLCRPDQITYMMLYLHNILNTRSCCNNLCSCVVKEKWQQTCHSTEPLFYEPKKFLMCVRTFFWALIAKIYQQLWQNNLKRLKMTHCDGAGWRLGTSVVTSRGLKSLFSPYYL